MNTTPKRFSGAQLLNILALSQNATAIYTTHQMIIEYANDVMLRFWGKDSSIIGMSLEEAVPELIGQPFIGMLQNVMHTGITDAVKAIQAKLFVDERLQTFYHGYEYRAIKNEIGLTYCILHTATDGTELFLNQHALNKAREKEIQLEVEQVLNE